MVRDKNGEWAGVRKAKELGHCPKDKEESLKSFEKENDGRIYALKKQISLWFLFAFL